MDELAISTAQMAEILDNLANSVISDNKNLDKLIFVGIQRRGADLANRISGILQAKTGKDFPCGSIDINLYRDDWTRLTDKVPHIGKTVMPCSLDGHIVILVDDVLFSGRTIRAALEALLDYGRPDKIKLLVLVDRGHRELPICANYVGERMQTLPNWRVDVLTKEHDGCDGVKIYKNYERE